MKRSVVFCLGIAGMVLLRLSVRHAHALTAVEVLAQQIKCMDDCDAAQFDCNRGCCGIFCSRGCLNACQLADNVCTGACNILGTIGASQVEQQFDETAAASANGRRVAVTGPIVCEAGFRRLIDVTLTQTGPGVAAKGRTRGTCTGEAQKFTVAMRTGAGHGFVVPGTAQLCGVVSIRHGHRTIRTTQWCAEVILLPEGTTLGQ